MMNSYSSAKSLRVWIKSVAIRFQRYFLSGAVLVALCAGLTAADPTNTQGNAPLMAISGHEEVSASGALSYTIPISVPPGTAKMAPTLSLDYSSSAGEQFMGLGWSLNGIPSISRCPRTIAEDNTHGSINYDAQDRFCYEGKRLVAINKNYGDDGAEYRLEVDNFTKFVSHGVSGTGPAWFEIHTKSGLTIYCGYNEDTDNAGNNSRFTLSSSNATARGWGAEKVSDAAGNYWIVKYVNDMTNGQSYPTEIDYTGNHAAGLTPFASVKFNYPLSKTFIIPGYRAGYLQQPTVLLQSIQTFVNGSLVHTYTLSYTPASSGASHDELHTLTQCDPSGPPSGCLATMTFGWQGTKDAPPMSSPITPPLTWSPGVGDFNGDGLLDLVPTFWNSTSPNCTAYSTPGTSWSSPYFGQPGGTFTPGGMTIGGSAACFQTVPNLRLPYPIDVNGDGYTDIFSFANGNTHSTSISINNRDGTFNNITGSACCTVPGDYNGDGLTDDFLPEVPWGYFSLSEGNGMFRDGGRIPISGTAVFPGDFNGDGCTDIYDGLNADLTCGAPVAQFAAPNCFGAISTTVAIGDFNGDGLSDIICAGQVYLATGTGFVLQGPAPSNPNGAPIVVGDWNGDGKTDLFIDHSVYLSTGTGFVLLGTTGGSFNSSEAKIADWNNDGAQDIWLSDPSFTTTGSQYQFSYVPERMNSVDNGLGKVTTVMYDRLNKNGTFYARSTSASYPTADYDSPMYVVSSVSTSNGIGGTYTHTYAYAGAQQDLEGRGFLGFQSVAVTDIQTNVVETTNYFTGYPLTGLVHSQTTVAPKTGGGTVTIDQTINSYEQISLGTSTEGVARLFVGLTLSTRTRNDEDFATGTVYAMPTTATTFSYDCDTAGACGGATPTGFGNVLQSIETITYGSNSSQNVVSKQYYPADTTDWLVAQVQTKTVEQITSTSDLTRHFSYAYYPITGLVQSEINEPSLPVTNPLHMEVDYLYDAFGNRTSISRVACIWTSATACSSTTRTDTAEYEVPTHHGAYLTKATNATGTQSDLYDYDQRFGAKTSHTDPNSLVETWTFDTFGRLTDEVHTDGTRAHVAYTTCTGLPSGESCPTNGVFDAILTPQSSGGSKNGPTSIAYFDALSRQIAADTQGFAGGAASWIRKATIYDALGHIYQTSRPYFLSGGTVEYTTFSYDPLARQTLASRPNGGTTTTTYQGLTTVSTEHVIHPDMTTVDQVTSTVRDLRGNKISVVDPTGKTVNFTYDAFDRMLTSTYQTSDTVTYTYDLAGRMLSMNDPDLGLRTYVVDGFGEVYSVTDAKGQTATHTYDVLGRPVERLLGGEYRDWLYDTATTGIGKLNKACVSTTSNPSCVATIVSGQTYTYDSMGRPSTTTLSFPTNYTYTTTYNTNNGKIATIAYPSGFVAQYTFTNLGYLCRLSDNSGTPSCSGAGGSTVYWTANSMNAEMQITQQTAGNGVGTAQSFDPTSGMIQTIVASISATNVANFSYSFDTGNNLASRSDLNQGYTESFCYDKDNRLLNYALASTCTATGGKTVSYSNIGAISSKSDVGTYQYPTAGSAHPHAVSSITGSVNAITNPHYVYDANGNMTCAYPTASNCADSSAQNFTYTPFDKTATMTSGSTSGTLTYDVDQQRNVQVLTASGTTTTTQYLNDRTSGGMSEMVTVGGGTAWHDYLTVGGRIVGERDTIGRAVTLKYFTADSLGSISVIADSVGSVIERLSYDAWGRRRNANGSDSSTCPSSTQATRGFTAQEEIDALCMVNLNARIYDPTLARLLTADTVLQDAFDRVAYDRYGYVESRPLSAVDPTGNDIEPETVVVVGTRPVPPVVTSPSTASPTFEGVNPDHSHFFAMLDLANDMNDSYAGPPAMMGAPVSAPTPPTISSTPAANGVTGTTSFSSKTATEKNLDDDADSGDAVGNAQPAGSDTNGSIQVAGLFSDTKAERVQQARNFFSQDQWTVDGKTIDPSKLSDEEVLKAFEEVVKEQQQMAILHPGVNPESLMELPSLKLLHSDEAMRGNLSSTQFWSKKSTEEIIESLRPGQRDSLKVKADGTVMDGNTRLMILQRRGVDINALPREPYP